MKVQKKSQRPTHRFVLLKILAMGDVVLAIQALEIALTEHFQRIGERLSEHTQKTGFSAENLEGQAYFSLTLYWVLDEKLVTLVRKMWEQKVGRWREKAASFGLDADLNLVPLAVSGKNLLAGGLATKIFSWLKLLASLHSVPFSRLCILHRDQRYQRLFSLFFPRKAARGCVVSGEALPGEKAGQSIPLRHEVDRMSRILSRSLSGLRVQFCNSIQSGAEMVTSRSAGLGRKQDPSGPSNPLRICLFVGGGVNDKTCYREKLWPHWRELTTLILQRTSWHVSWCGLPEDGDEALRLESFSKDQIPRLQDARGLWSLTMALDEIGKMDAFVGADGGISHLADFAFEETAKPIIQIFGPTHEGVWSVAGARSRAPELRRRRTYILSDDSMECRPCYDESQGFRPCVFQGTAEWRKCMDQTSAEAVFHVLSQALSNPSS